MDFELYDKCQLKDGQVGWIVEILDNGESYIIELDKKGLDNRIVTVLKNEVLEKIG